MFNKDFYPTPIHIVEIMTMDIDAYGKTVLEPSSGKGDIIDHLIKIGANVLCCENNRDLAKISSQKATLISNDFFDVKSEDISHVDFIIMNPPFSQDEKHILHAWNISPPGCHIISLCNWETIENTYVRRRRELQNVINNYGNSKCLGDVFKKSERSTSAEIGLINLYKPAEKEEEFEGYFDLNEDHQTSNQSGLVSHNDIIEIVHRYIGAVKLFDEVESISARINDLSSVFDRHNQISFGAYKRRESNYHAITRDEYKKQLQKAAWKTVFDKLNMQKYVTKSVLEKLNKFVESQINVPFKVSNIYKMVEIIFQTYEENMNKAIIEIFEKLTMHSDENRYNVEGWKTNGQYLINQKFIMPWMVSPEYGNMRLMYTGNGYLVDDMAKSLCFLTGKSWSEVGDIWSRFHDKKDEPTEFGKWYDWGFFEFKGYKKRTVHFKFKNEHDWAILNQRIAKIKGWALPEKVKKSRSKTAKY